MKLASFSSGRLTREGIYEFARQMTGNGIVTWVVFVCMVPGSGLFTLMSPLESDSANPLARVLISMGAAAIAMGAVILTWLTLLRHLRGWTRIILTFTAYAAGGILKATIQHFVNTSIGIEDWGSQELFARMLTTSTQWFVALGIIAFSVSSTRDYYKRLKILSTSQQVAGEIMEAAKTDALVTQDQLISTVRDTMSRDIDKLRQSDPQNVIADTQKFVEETVRPLSHRLSREVPNWTMPKLNADQAKLNWPRFFLDTPATGTLSALWTTVTVAVFALGYFLATQGVVGTIVSYIFLMPALFILFFIAIRLSRLIQVANPWLQLTLNCAALVAAGVFPAIVLRYLSAQNWYPAVTGSVSVIVVGPILLTMLSIGMACHKNHDQVASVVERMQNQLVWLETRIGIERWARHGQVARALHGPYQAVIYSHIVSYQQLLDQGKLTQAEIPRLANNLDNELERALDAENEQQSLELALERVVAMWSDVAKINYFYGPAARNCIEPDPAISDLASGLLHDGIINAIRHAKATAIDISIANTEPYAVQITISDNGPVSHLSSGSGLGFAQFDTNTLEWDLTRTVEGHRLRLLLPCSATIEQMIARQQDGIRELV